VILAQSSPVILVHRVIPWLSARLVDCSEEIKLNRQLNLLEGELDLLIDHVAENLLLHLSEVLVNADRGVLVILQLIWKFLTHKILNA